MKKIVLFFAISMLIISCTSNTIFKKPDDLIPKDTMQMLIIDMIIASSAKYQQNKNLEKNINYMPLVYQKYKIDSSRFDKSNIYYTSRIDEYQKMTDTIKSRLEALKKKYTDLNKIEDSLRRDSIQKKRSIPKDLIKDLKENS